MSFTRATLIATLLLTACGGSRSTAAPLAPPADAAGAWTMLGDSPAPRADHAAVYDAARDRMLVFGGAGNDLWAQALSGPHAGEWTRLHAGGDRPPPVAMVPVIDEGTDRLLLFPADSLDRAWALPLGDGGAWSVLGFGDGPKISLAFSLAADPAGRRLFAYTSGTPELWELPLGGGSWQQVAGSPVSSGFACRDVLVFDGARQRLLVLSGGWPRGNVYAIPLQGDGAWTQLNQDQAWFDYGSAAIYDAHADRFLVAGRGQSGWVWSFALGDPAPSWTHLPIGGDAPSTFLGASAIYDAHQHRMVLFGGRGDDTPQSLQNRTLAATLDDSPAWSRIGTLDDPIAPIGGAFLAYATDTHDVLRLGGTDGGPALVYRPAQADWRSLGPLQGGPEWPAAGVWDPVRARVTALAGYDADNLGQTWSFDPETVAWTPIALSGTRPSGRTGHSLARDDAGDRVIVFGGMSEDFSTSDVQNLADTWIYAPSTDTWSEVIPSGPTPAPRYLAAAAVDGQGGRLFIHGGFGDTGTLTDTWALDLATSRWTPISPAGATPPTFDTAFAAFDAASRRLLVVGDPVGDSSTADGAEVWALSTDGAPIWHRYCPTGTRPGHADGMVQTADGLFVVAGGATFRFDPTAPTCD